MRNRRPDLVEDLERARRFVKARHGGAAARLYGRHEEHVAGSAPLSTLYGRAEMLRGRDAAAERLFQRAELLARNSGDLKDRADALYWRGGLYLMNGFADAAAECAFAARKVYAQISAPDLQDAAARLALRARRAV